MELLICKHCGGALGAEDKFCPHCGEETSEIGQEIALVLPRGVTKLTIRFAENGTKSNQEQESAQICPEDIAVPEQCYLEGLKCAVGMGIASISMLQRKLGVSYSKAGEIIEWMQENGLIGPWSDSSARKIYCTKEQLAELIERYKENSQ